MIPKKIIKYLDKQNVKYELVEHKKVYTAYDAAQTLKVKLDSIGKALLVKFNKPFMSGNKPYAVVLLGADKNLDLVKFKKVVNNWAVQCNKELRYEKPDKDKRGKVKKRILDIYNKVSKVSIPKERDMKEKLKIKPGAISAFGEIYKLPVFIDKAIIKKTKIILPSGSFTESIKMSPKQFIKLEKAMQGSFSKVKKIKKKK